MLDQFGVKEVKVRVPCGQTEHPVLMRLYPNACVEVLYNPCDLLPDNLRKESTCYEVLEVADERLKLFFGYRMLGEQDLEVERSLWLSERYYQSSQGFYQSGLGTLNEEFWSYVREVFEGRDGYRQAVMEAGASAPKALQGWARTR